MRHGWGIGLLALAGGLAACSVGPDYEVPKVAPPAAYKEPAGWRPARPADAIPKGAWWTVFGDAVLDGLEDRLAAGNQSLAAQEAVYRQAVAAARTARAGLFPAVTAAPSATRARTKTLSSRGKVANTLEPEIAAGWEADLWGKVRRSVEAGRAAAQASAGDLESLRLSLQAQLAEDYLELRIAEELKRLYDDTADAYARSLAITRNQYAAGVASYADVAQAEAQLAATRASAVAAEISRAELEHALAVLVGVPPAEFAIARAPLSHAVPVIPAGVPSALLERRPDIAAAERTVAAANARIGVAIAAYYPDVSLSATFGFLGGTGAHPFLAANRVWSMGAAATQVIFDAGATSAGVESARAAWEQSVAAYRETVLTAFREVEDALVGLRLLETQSAAQAEAVRASAEAERRLSNQYKAGTVAYTAVVTAQTTLLANRRSLLTILESRQLAAVDLIKAVGGGWDASQLPEVP